MSITFVNAGYNVAEPPNIHFNYATPRNLFLYFQSTVTLNGRVENPGTCIFYGKDAQRDYISMDNFVNSYVSFTVGEEIFSKLGIKTNKPVYPSDCERINDLIFKITAENANGEIGCEEKTEALILDLIVTVAREINKKESPRQSDLKNRLERVRAMLLEDISNPPQFDDILREAGVSRTQGYKLYARFFHSSPKEDLIWARLEKARSILRANPEMKICDIVNVCGFSNPSHFFRTFKSKYGYTPKDYAAAIKTEKIRCRAE